MLFRSRFSDDHIDWRYDTVIAIAAGKLETSAWNQETHDIGWFTIEEIDKLELHPSFAKTWPNLSQEIIKHLNQQN